MTITNDRTQCSVLNLLKQRGPTDAASLAQELKVTPMAVRQHLYALQERDLVTFEMQPRPMGRPAKLWRLTSQTDHLFPDAHARLTVGLISAMKETFGPDGLHRLLETRKQHLVQAYREQMPPGSAMSQKLEALAGIRTAEGYMAEVENLEDGSWLLIENHCAICLAASQCQRFCEIELEVFQQVLGPQVHVERKEFIQAGARRCTYRIEQIARA